MYLELPELEQDPRYPYERPSADERDWVKSFPLSDFGLTLIVDLTCQYGEPYQELTVSVAARHALDFNEVYEISVRKLVDEQIASHVRPFDGSTDSEGIRHLMMLAKHFEDTAAHLRRRASELAVIEQEEHHAS